MGSVSSLGFAGTIEMLELRTGASWSLIWPRGVGASPDEGQRQNTKDARVDVAVYQHKLTFNAFSTWKAETQTELCPVLAGAGPVGSPSWVCIVGARGPSTRALPAAPLGYISGKLELEGEGVTPTH